MLALLVLPLVYLSRIDSQGSIAQPVGDSTQHEIHRTIVRNLMEWRLLGQNRVGSARVSLKAVEDAPLCLRLLVQIEHWDKRLVLLATDVRVRVLLAHKGCWQAVIWATGHFARAAFRHTLIVEADATGTTKDSGNG